jgi:hypothetical protein
MARKSADLNGMTVVLDVGQEAEGYYLNSTDKDRGPNLSRVHNFVNRDGEGFQIWGSAALDRIFCGDIGKELEKERPKVPQGVYVWVKRTEDLSENAKGVKFRQPMKNYTVDFDDEDWAEGYGPGSQNEAAPAMKAAPSQGDAISQGEPAVPKSVAQAAEPKATEEEDDDMPF